MILYKSRCCLSQQHCKCERRFRPVCGSDEITYDSECHLHCERQMKTDLRLLYSGTCCPKNACPSVNSPVCDNFGRTHQNECRFHFHKCLAKKLQNKKLYIQHIGECRPDERQDEDCTAIFCDQQTDGPVCDQFGNTHNSTCKFDQVNCERRNRGNEEIALAYHGRCRNETEIAEKELLLVMTHLNLSTTEIPTIKKPKKLKKIKIGKKTPSIDRKALASKIRSQSEGKRLEVSKFEEMKKEEQDEQPFSAISAIFGEDENLPWDLSIRCSAVSCKKDWHPVCDHQGRTHKNPCLFQFFACKLYRHEGIILEISHQGECKDTKVYKGDDEPCGVCSTAREKTPVCDNRNQTHPSLCHLAVWNCQMERKGGDRRVLVHIGSCHKESPIFTEKEETCPERCPEETRPVCDEKMIEHKNLCAFQMKNCVERKAGGKAAHLVSLSPCPNEKNESNTKENKCFETKCSNESQPICDSQGNQHLNLCLFEREKCKAELKGIRLKIERFDKCEKCKSDCFGVDVDAKSPICANDYVTYDSDCHFQKAKCMNDSLAVLFKGSCSLCFHEECPLLGNDAPDGSLVCDQNGQTRSRCEFNALHCVLTQNFGYNLSVLHEGRCCASLDNCATAPSNPLCASDGLTYSNICLFEIARCQKMKKMGIELLMINEGACANTTKKVTPRASDSSEQQGNDINQFPTPQPMSESCDFAEKCGHEYSPICGSDNKIYTNACELKEAKCLKDSSLTVQYVGECCQEDCPVNWSPVCDSDRKSHQNLCFFGLARCLEERKFGRNLTISKFDLCENEIPCKECTKVYEPICANNEETFVNECELERYNCLIERRITSGQRVHKGYSGECCSTKPCPLTYDPLCDSHGRTHPNQCAFQQHQCKLRKTENETIEIAYKGQCCGQPCEETVHPVCDGTKTHSNMCKFRVAQCEAERVGEVLLLAYAGECCTMGQGDCAKSGHLCDSDGQTHADLCHFKEKQCIMERNRLKNITIVHTGECCKIESCDKTVDPVCDSNGGTHASLCHFKNTKCIHDKLHPNNTLHFEYTGACCASNCPGDWEPVCDQHGRVYKNNCFFQLKSCELRRRSGGVLLETPCPDRRTRSYNLKSLNGHHNFPVGSRIYHV
ncbi:unnamed protein product, partial [Mesorhabditis belari]|uniref:Kazal-like domain-containing protein n=1 Tax=Mesorhabditis belari TaxID=2138241 RepID=A0AAF3ES06_9BILA